MTTIYENAFLTLAATGSAGSTEGLCLGHERPRHFSQFSVSKGADLAYLRSQPLYKRGWTLQEMALSPRLVHFAEDGLYWVFRSRTESEHGQSLGSGTSLSHLKSPPNALDRKIWWEWMEDYSARQLARPSDKLPALPGLTKKFQHLTGDRPAVGLCLEDMHYGLLWKPAQSPPQRPTPTPLHD